MKLVKPTALSFSCRPVLIAGRQRFVVTSLVGFSLAEGPRRLIPEIALWPAVARATDGLLDEGLPKPRAEVLLFGSCHTPKRKPLPASYVRLQVGAVDKKLSVLGDRTWQDGAFQHPTTEPVPFAVMPLRWDRAFGGLDYPKNPLGRGIDAVNGKVALPNIEPGSGLLSARADRPEPAGFGPFDVAWPQRMEHAGTYDARWLETEFPGYARDTDPAFFSTAPRDQRIDGFFRGDEPYVLENLHPTRPRMSGALPGVAARTFLRGRGRDRDFTEVKTRLDSVVFLPGEEIGILVFRGTADVEEDDAADVTHVLAVCEEARAPRDVAHYRSAFERRLDKDESPLLALQEDDMLPAFARGAGLDAVLEKAAQQVASPAALGASAIRELVETRARAQAADHGVDFDAGLAQAKERQPPALAELARLEALVATPDLFTPGGAAALQKAIGPATEGARAYLEAVLAEAKASVTALPEREPAPPGPPAPQAPRILEELAAAGRPADDATTAKLRELDASALAAYRGTAHYLDAGKGDDLSGRNLEGHDLHDALLAAADLTGANARQANLSGATLAHATARHTRFDGANLARANLGAATIEGAHFDGANLTGAKLSRAKIVSASFREANLAEVELLEAELGTVDFEGASAPGLSFLQAIDLTKCRFVRTRLRKANFLETKLDGVDFAGALLELVTFVTVSANGASFRGADLNRLHAVAGCSFRSACFDNANLEGAFLRGADLRGASFVGANLKGADLSECNLTGAKLTRARAREALFIRADLTDADVQDSDLMDAMLQKSTLKGTNLSRASLFAANLGQVRLDTGTRIVDANLKRALLLPKLGGSS